ncbi:MAG: BON domain-containing protein [Pseudomonadota bacterium]
MANVPGDELPQHLASFLEADSRLQGCSIRVRPENGHLALVGEVPHISSKRIAAALARRAAGEQPVIDRLKLQPSQRLDDAQVRDALTHALLHQRELHNCTVRQQDHGRSELLQEAHDDWPSGEIEIEVEDGEITLTGKVISLSHQRMIEALAWRTPGCRNVVDRLQVVPAEDDNDYELIDAIRLVLEMDPLVPADQVGIRSEDGVVTLEGVLAHDEARRIAETDAWSVCGVVEVRNRIEVRTKEPALTAVETRSGE